MSYLGFTLRAASLSGTIIHRPRFPNESLFISTFHESDFWKPSRISNVFLRVFGEKMGAAGERGFVGETPVNTHRQTGIHLGPWEGY